MILKRFFDDFRIVTYRPLVTPDEKIGIGISRDRTEEICEKLGTSLGNKAKAKWDERGKAEIDKARGDKKKLAISFFSSQREALIDMRTAVIDAFANQRAAIAEACGIDGLEKLVQSIIAQEATARRLQMETSATTWASLLAQCERGKSEDGVTDMSSYSDKYSGVVKVGIASYYRKADCDRLPVAMVTMSGVNAEGQRILSKPIKDLPLPVIVSNLYDPDPGAQISRDEKNNVWTGPKVPKWWLDEWGGGPGIIEQIGTRAIGSTS